MLDASVDTMWPTAINERQRGHDRGERHRMAAPRRHRRHRQLVRPLHPAKEAESGRV